ncbi:MAG: hypothetical protein IKL59_07280 [Clostridia bacterium]|nr:hypothetical protein [Clostridia bacterium]
MSDHPESSVPSVSAENNQLSDAFQKILANPEIISTVASVIGMPAPKVSPEGEPAAAEPSADALSAFAPILNSLSKKDPSPRISSNQASLLRALKPYVNPNRCEAIDYIIKISEISQLLKKIN